MYQKLKNSWTSESVVWAEIPDTWTVEASDMVVVGKIE